MKNFPLLIGTILFTITLVFGAVVLFSGKQKNQSSPVDQQQLTRQGKNNSFGSQSADITIVEFSDFQCPACRATQPLIKEVTSQFPQIRLIYRHFPLTSIHPNAQIAAQATEVAAEYDQFWPMHDLLFEKQTEWVDLSKDQLIEKFAQYAQELQIDKNEFLTKIESQDIKQRVDLDVTAAINLNLSGTPTFFVNGVQTSAPQLKQAVESLLTN